MEFTKKNARAWMLRNVGDFEDKCGGVNCTSLVESCCEEFDEDGLGGPVDDNDHWVWELAIDVSEGHENVQ